MRSNFLTAAAMASVAAVSLAGCSQYGDAYGSTYRSGYDAPPGTPYYAEQYYRDDPRYHERRLRDSDNVYVGNDGRYYCKRSDGTTGLIVGAALGGLLGGQLDRGRSNTAGILIGAGAGALLGREVDRGNLSCR